MARRILIVTNRAPWPLHDGGAMAMHQLILGYKQQGWAVHLLLMNTVRHAADESVLREAYADLDGLTAVPLDNRLRPARLLRNLLTSSQPEHAERFFDAAFERVLLEVVQRFSPDAIQFESLFLTGYVPALRAATAARLILRLHNVEHQIWARAAASATGAKRLYLRSLSRRMKRYERRAWERYDLLLPITQDDAQMVEDAGCKTPQHFTPYGISTAAADTLEFVKNFARPVKLYHLGGMDWLPNREGVLWFIREVWPLIHLSQPDSEFHFAGRRLETDFSAPLPAGVFNHGAVGDAIAFIDRMDALVVPLRAGGGIRVKILEAMAAGKVVIATSVGIQGIDAVAGEHYLLAITAEEFATQVDWIARHPEETMSIAARARTLVRNVYDAGKIADGLSRRVAALADHRPQGK